MAENESVKEGTSLLELTKSLGPGWKPISVQTHHATEGVNVLKQTITLSYVKVDDQSENGQGMENTSNLKVRVFNENG